MARMITIRRIDAAMESTVPFGLWPLCSTIVVIFITLIGDQTIHSAMAASQLSTTNDHDHTDHA
ncbi:hypothetical protein C448_10602 [Halococcus morrhuae DSM 1307]|uniref:Uncharacterized protein n=1 Tax=Halococcus morrhuae DSM 1307 TaxID=931277 RepID=M0MA01_HALMO|nr:hypothetical protein C448_10602 [Halococcus morrhuae DSM 1307]